VPEVFDSIRDALERGEDVKIAGFGTFKRVATQARTCRNPHTGEAIEVPAGSKVKFKASSKLSATAPGVALPPASMQSKV
jgi:DNA-binding protein HU-beta